MTQNARLEEEVGEHKGARRHAQSASEFARQALDFARQHPRVEWRQRLDAVSSCNRGPNRYILRGGIDAAYPRILFPEEQ